MKLCGDCAEIKAEAEFYARSDNGQPRAICKECECADQRRRRAESPATYRARACASYRKHIDKNLSRAKQHRQTNLEACRSAVNRWRKGNLSRVRILNQRRRARLASVLNTLTEAQWDAILREYSGCCRYCGSSENITMDHIIPIARGGPHTAENVCPACARCNGRKGIQTGEEFIAVAVIESYAA